MARRFGGKYSPNASGTPGATDTADQPVATPDTGVGLKANLLFALPFPFLIKAFRGDPTALFVGLGSAALLLGTIEGHLNPLFPFLFGMVGAFLHIGAFGPDPMRAKGLEGVDSFQTDRVAKAVDEGETYLAGMKDAILRANDPALEARVDRFASAARSLFRSIEGNPGDLSAARRYFSVYLMGARDATVKFADVYAQGRSAPARADYEALLTDLETTFAARTTALASGGQTDLDVEISVLRDRLKLEA